MTTSNYRLRELTFARMSARESFNDTVASVLREVYATLPRGSSLDAIDAAVEAHPRVQAARKVSQDAQAALSAALAERATEDRASDATDLAHAYARTIRPAYDPATHVYGPIDLDLSRATANLARMYERFLFGTLEGVALVGDSLFLAMEVDPVPDDILVLRRIQTALAGQRVTQTVYLYLGGEERGLRRPMGGSLIVEVELVTENGVYSRDALDEIARTAIP